MNSETKHPENNKFLAQNTNIEESSDNKISDSDTDISLDSQNEIDNSNLSSRNDQTFQQCSSAGDIYSDEELNE